MTKPVKLTFSTMCIHLFFILFSLAFLLPFLMIISVSLSNEQELMREGYRLLPMRIDFTAYRYVFENPAQMIDSYIITAFQALFGTLLALIVMALCAYPLSLVHYKLRNTTTFFIFFTMLFGGGLIPSYILNTQYLHIGNTFWIYILPTLANAFHIIILRTFFQGIPYSLAESAKMDGARELTIFFRIILPLSKPVLATIALFNILDRWNNWYTSLIYVNNSKLYTLQYLLQKILMDAEFVKSLAQDAPPGMFTGSMLEVPTESMKFAMCIVAAGPMLVIFPFFQKYFAKGLTIGAVKG
ncbi:carbohydrate ABC transporter permease [Paenibacillus sp. HWE-109]|uniref:carbohydrate ABC transporter permease n=1 Tax=Paenibacillus sp. HWE-109 TaxID=1306526 RepID=UPI001EDCD380|nr:carbohydrate ABC transporter permease [Paenibacillus sp. HWE-109]UKS27894.1 carbohydrate ABC transporter permease [Paenibacillus sp. HWE-109]